MTNVKSSPKSLCDCALDVLGTADAHEKAGMIPDWYEPLAEELKAI